MASTSRRRRARDDEDDNDDDGVPSEAPSSSPPSGTSKRRRVDNANDSSDDSPGGRISSAAVAQTNGQGGDGDDFHPGAIVRVTVENFVTYEKAEFFPGPNLNMVIGPNGTGKSSLVCAICLGLGYSPKHLGRAGSVKEFVKHGKDMATIEIELKKKPQDRSNYVIRVQIKREQNSQKWWLNRKETTHKKIHELTRSLKIQVDNLCQFLPQDRVVEFAACGPVELLHETLRAAAPEKMLEWQAQLRDLQKDKKELSEAVSTDADTLKNLETRQQGLQAEVDRLREREEILHAVKTLKMALPVALYREARDDYDKAKKRRKQAERDLKRLEEQSGPSLEAVNEKQAYARAIEMVISDRNRDLEDTAQAVRDRNARLSEAADTMKGFDDKIEATRASHDSHKKNLGISKQKITSLQADLKNKPPEFVAAEWNQKIRAEEHNLRETDTEHQEVSSEFDKIGIQGRTTKAELQKTEALIESFNTQEGQKMSFMRHHFPDAAQAWEWLQEHRGEFEKEIFGPPMVSCSLKDERYSDQIQAVLQRDDFSCFTAQTKADYLKLNDQLYNKMGLSVGTRSCTRPLSAFRPPLSAAETGALGFDGFAVDFLDGPEPVLAMLCAEKKLHMSGVSLTDHSDAQFERIKDDGRVNTWSAGKQSFVIRRRKEYGPQAVTVVTKHIQRGAYWTSQPIDSAEKAGTEKKLLELKGEFEELKEHSRSLKAKRDALQDRKDEITKKIDTIRHEKNALQREFAKWQAIPGKIEAEERAKASHEEAMREVRQTMQDMQYEWDDAMLAKAEVVLQHAQAVQNLQDAQGALDEARIWLIEANSDIEGLKERNADILEQLEAQKRNIEEAASLTEQYRAAAREQADVLGTVLADIDEERRAEIQLLAQEEVHEEGDGADEDGVTPERPLRSTQIRHDISAEEAKLELIHTANPNVIQDFERRAGEITKLKKKMGSVSEKLAGITGKTQEIMAKFEPRLDDLVSRVNDAFAYNFEQISCAGEVRVQKTEDFEQWALIIMVKFRENESLQQLDSRRQSGGERAVSTIFFLMALQSMAQSPFRVVDEINQGMDPRNERMVHERMVEIACREHTSQYFLITPKLLTGLRYDRKMRVLCIASGEHMPREGRKLDLRRCLSVQKSLMAGA